MEGIGKTRAFLTEFIIVILFFSLSAVITLQLFLAANEKSHASTEQTNIYLKLQSAAEEVRGYTDIDSYFSAENGWEEGICCYREDFSFCSKEEAAYIMTASVTQQEEETGVFANVLLTMFSAEKQEELGALEICVYRPDWRAKQ